MAGDSAVAMDVPFGSLAMNLECLGAEFYSFAAFGKGLSEELRGGGPPSVGGRKANISGPLQVRTHLRCLCFPHACCLH